MDIDQLIHQAGELKTIDYSSPRIKLWEKRTKDFVENNYDKTYVDILEDALSWGQIITPGEGPQLHSAAMTRAIEFLDNLKQEPLVAKSESALVENGEFIAESILLELRKIKSAEFDIKKLLRFCEELNDSYSSGNYFSCAFLIRAVMNHVPPIFSHQKFSQVVVNSGKSLKKIFSQLEQDSRPIADLHAHIVIRKKEQLPSKHQIEPYKPSFEILIQEIISLLS